MKAIAIKSLLLTVTLATPLALLPDTASASRGSSHARISYSSGYGHNRTHVSVGRHSSSHSRHYGSYGSRSRSSHYYPSSYSRSRYYRSSPSYYSRSRSYYSKPRISVSIGGGYYGGYYSSLPYGYTSCVVGGSTYYRYGGNYYRPYNSGYVVVKNPYVLEPRTVTVVEQPVGGKYDGYPRIWVNGSEYLIDDGALFHINATGLVWADLPLGSISSTLPTHSTSVWYNEIEYFQAGGIYFQKIPEGYRIIDPPWRE